MQVFRCDHCDEVVEFSAERCSACGTQLGYVSEQGTIRALTPAGAVIFEVAGHDGRWWRCLNAAWGCNWMLPASAGGVWCRSCRLTRGRPDEFRRDAVEAWSRAEAAKRRLVHQLDVIGLPIEERSDEHPDGLAFDLVHLTDETPVTGHLAGVITLDLAEADDRHRDRVRRLLGEPYRTVIGHLRHEMGHYYFDHLVRNADEVDAFRRLFGDERADYRGAMDAHYSSSLSGFDALSYISAYAASHPLEDWAETFAHYLHILDATDTAVAHQLGSSPVPDLLDVGIESAPDFDAVLGAWRSINDGLTAVAESLGVAPLYPFDLTGEVADKLGFVHARVAQATRSDRFHVVR
jgi:hypothetical protein